MDGRQRAGEPGFLLVAVVDEQGPPVGFVHVLVIDGHAHLEQLSRPARAPAAGDRGRADQSRDGRGPRPGVRAPVACTYRDVPWNGPYYRSLGFREVAEADLAPYQRRLRDHERDLRLDVNGVRCVMEVALG